MTIILKFVARRLGVWETMEAYGLTAEGARRVRSTLDEVLSETR